MQEQLKNKLWNIIEHHTLLILGFGREGQSTYHLLRAWFPSLSLAIADRNEEITNHPTLQNDPLITLHTGSQYLDAIEHYSLIIKSPGISFFRAGISPNQQKITSQTDLMFKLVGKQIIGITGTKGKSTTTTLIHHLLSHAFDDVRLAGNIGIPVMDQLTNWSEQTIMVAELSAHQLEYIHSAPHYGILLNLFEEHLDHYASYDNYRQAKLNLFQYMESSDTLVFHHNDNYILNSINKAHPPCRLMRFALSPHMHDGCYITQNRIWFHENGRNNLLWDLNEPLPLIGQHNQLNIMAALTIVLAAGMPVEKIKQALRTFKGLEHRLEFIGTFHNVSYYNDSIATIPQATIEAIEALKKVDTVILGGMDRGIDYTPLVQYLLHNKINNILCTGKAGLRISELLTQEGIDKKRLFHSNNYIELTRYAVRHTAKNMQCLLSPAAASYDQFKNFEERGLLFKKLIHKLSDTEAIQ